MLNNTVTITTEQVAVTVVLSVGLVFLHEQSFVCVSLGRPVPVGS